MTPYFLSKHARAREGKLISLAGREDVLTSLLADCRKTVEMIGYWCMSIHSELYLILSRIFFTVLHFTVEEACAIEGTLKQMRIAIQIQKKNKCRIGDIVTY